MRLFGDFRWAFIRCISRVGAGLRRNWFPIWIAGWMAAVYTERIITDIRIRKDQTFGQAASSSITVVFFSFEWMLLMWAFVLEEDDVPRYRAWLRRVLHDYRADIWSLTIFAGFALYAFLRVFFTDPLDSAINLSTRWFRLLINYTWETFAPALPALIVLLILYGFYRIIARLFVGPDPVFIAFREWTLGVVPILLGLLIYIGLYRQWIFGSLSEPGVRFAAWRGLLKDSFIYTLVAFVLIQGLYRYRRCCHAFQNKSAKWWGFVAIAAVTGTLTAMALLADLHYLDELPRLANPEYPPSAFPILRWHIFIRDWVMLLPLVATMLVWLAGELLGAWKVFADCPVISRQ